MCSVRQEDIIHFVKFWTLTAIEHHEGMFPEWKIVMVWSAKRNGRAVAWSMSKVLG